MPNFTRPELRPLENQLVFVSGRITQWHKNRGPEGKNDDICLSNVRLWTWDRQAAVDLWTIAPTATTEHLWVRGTSGAIASERLAETICVGRISYYTRSDGTADLGLEVRTSYCLDDAAKRVASASRDIKRDGLPAARKAFDYALDALAAAYGTQDDEEVLAFSHAYRLQEAVQRLEDYAMSLDRLIKATSSRLDAQAHLRRGPCKGLDLALPRQSSRKAQARGFLA
jgi:hypothetical protein